jgi:rhodanese-related sulfurtransferase
MKTSKMQIVDPTQAQRYFEDKVAFTTGPVELEHMIKENSNDFTVVDVRAAEDFAKGHIPGALNLPRGTWESAIGLSKDKTNIVYCYSQVCHLAANACVAFAWRGFAVMEMEGGFEAWQEHELEIEHEASNRVEKQDDRLLHGRR